jgi:integrase
MQRWPYLQTCRHTFPTRLVLAGADLVTVRDLLGHADIKTTMRYAHPTPESKRKAITLLSSIRTSGTWTLHPSYCRNPPVI